MILLNLLGNLVEVHNLILDKNLLLLTDNLHEVSGDVVLVTELSDLFLVLLPLESNLDVLLNLDKIL